MNKLLLQQLYDGRLVVDKAPSDEGWKFLLKTISNTYDELETQRSLQLQTVLESVPCLVIWVDSELNVLEANNRGSEFLNGHDLSSFNISEVSSFDDMTRFLELFFASEDQEQSFHFSYVPFAETLEFRFIAKKLNDSKKAVLVGIDMTSERKRQNELELTRAKSISQSRMATLGEMAAGMAHEINNPLAVISVLSQQLKQKVLGSENEAELLTKLSKIVQTTERITKIINGLRSFARNGEKDPFESTSLNTIIGDTLELCKQRFALENIELRVAAIPTDWKIDCRATQISQVILNLLSNARDAISEKNEKWIEIKVYDVGLSIKIQVTDSGSGITKEIASKIMNPFFTTKEVGVGTGLGLSISKGIVEAHEGRLYFDHSCPNTRFVVQLPKHQMQSQIN